jgi:adenylate cyclase
VSLDPSSVYALNWVAYYLIEASPDGWANSEDMLRAERLLARAREIAPSDTRVLNTTVYWLRTVGRCQEVIELAQQALQTDPHRMRRMTGVYNELGRCKTWTGHAEDEIVLQEKVNQLNPSSAFKFIRYRRMGVASLLLGRDEDAIAFFQRSFALNPEARSSQAYSQLAAAYVRTGQMEEARRWISEANRLSPYDTVRGQSPDGSSSTIYAEQIRRFQVALRLAGERDHADEDADFGVPGDRVLHSDPVGHTPKDAPGASTVRTTELARVLAEARPVVIDTATNSWGLSIPGAVGLRYAGIGGSFTDAAQDHLGNKTRELTGGDVNRPIVAVGWNSERFDGRNLALRLVALGYTNVYWYRGGREAWEVAGLPETAIDMQDW